MMRSNIFEYDNYVDFLKAWITEKGHGSKSLIAQAAEIQTAYLSLIIKSEAHFSLEQALKLKNLFEMNHAEIEFFLLLLQKEKAGTQELKSFFQGHIQNIQLKRQTLKERIENQIEFSLEDKIKYFSHWKYAAIHTALLNEKWRTVKTLEKLFFLSSEAVIEVLDFLLSLNLIKKKNSEYFVDNFRIHIPNDSAVINLHHQNWRFEGLRSLQNVKKNDLHFSSIFSLSESDALEFKNQLLRLLEEFDKKIKISRDEVLYSLGLDWFEYT